MERLDYTKPIMILYGVDSQPFRIKPGFCVIDLLFDEKLVADLGFSPFNSNVLRNGLALNCFETLLPGELLTIETAAHFKEALPGPKLHKCERYRRKQGFEIEPSKGDHAKWIISGHAVSVNYCNGELDIKSLKDLAHHLNLKPRDLISSILTS